MNATAHALLQEMKNPTYATREDIQSVVAGLVPLIAKVSQQAAEIRSLAQQAEIAEDDDEVRGRLQHYIQISGGMQRICRNLEKESRDLLTCLRRLRQADEEIRPKAKAAGYDV